MKVRALDVLFGLKAINLTPDLKNNDRPVAATLLDHFNRQTGQCDPSLERIAQLLNISPRTVIRSIARIEAAGLFTRERHGGHLNRNSYQPNWKRFRDVEAAWSARTKAKSQWRRMTMVSSGPCQPCHITKAVTSLSLKPVQTTCLKKPLRRGRREKETGPGKGMQHTRRQSVGGRPICTSSFHPCP
jgi:DNA-binding Lrp family transcriptional regulator